MRLVFPAIAILSTLAATDASAQALSVNLSGRWQCVAQCVAPPNTYSYITQNGWELNMVNGLGMASRAWVDYPGRIWINAANEGAIYTPDGNTIQFDRGTIWQRAPLRGRRG